MANSTYSTAGTALGLGGNLADQVAGETEEERKKRLALEAQKRALGPLATPYGAAAKALGLGYGGGG
jgi:hypothetical protein